MNTLTADWRKILGVTDIAVLVILVGAHHALLAILLAAVNVAALVLILRAKLVRFSAGGWMAARRRRKHQGWANFRELHGARAAAAKLTRRICPGAGLLELGKSHRAPVAVARENSALYSGPPGAGKTAALACHAADAPGLLLCTSTKTSLMLHALPYRQGRVWVLNADRYGGIPSTLAWSPVEGCEDTETAMRRAGDLMAASPRDPSGRDMWYEDRGAQLIQYMLRAAAAVGVSMREVNAWVRDPESMTPMVILQTCEPAWAAELLTLISGEGDSLSHVISSAKAALGWMDNAVLADAACPPPGHGFSMATFARSGDSVFLIGKKRPRGSLAPFYAAFGAELFEQLKHYAEEKGGRLPVPATFVLDEMPLTCPMPLHDMLAESREPMITIIAAIQTLAQLRAKFGQDDGDTIRSACPVEVHYGGEKRIEDLEAVSDVIGDHDTWQGDMDNLLPESLMPPGALRMLKKGKAVILMPECRPVLASLPAIWDRPGHQQATATHPAFQAAEVEVPELTEAQREAMLRAQRRQPLAIEPPRPIALPAGEDAGVYAANGRAV